AQPLGVRDQVCAWGESTPAHASDHACLWSQANPEGGSMPRIEDSIEVQVPVARAYNQWTQFEEFPKFMEGIQSVQQLDATHVHWGGESRGGSRQWTTEIAEQQPDERIAWKTIDGEVKNDG